MADKDVCIHSVCAGQFSNTYWRYEDTRSLTTESLSANLCTGKFQAHHYRNLNNVKGWKQFKFFKKLDNIVES